MHSTVKCLKNFKSTQIFYEDNGRPMYCTSILYDWGMCINKHLHFKKSSIFSGELPLQELAA